MTGFEFLEWPKIARLYREVVVTEKIDGTNAAVHFDADGGWAAQSRKRLITPDDDNFGFARWVADYAEVLFEALGEGIHFGEWWGSGIQRGYGLPKGEKRFSLFNTRRWAEAGIQEMAPGLGVVPILYQGIFNGDDVHHALRDLEAEGSAAAPGFLDPEGIVVFHSAANLCLKTTIKGDDAPKGVEGA